MTYQRGDPQYNATPEATFDLEVTELSNFLGFDRKDLAEAAVTDVESWFLTPQQRGALSTKPPEIHSMDMRLLTRRVLILKLNCLHQCLLTHLGSESEVCKLLERPVNNQPGGVSLRELITDPATSHSLKHGLDTLREHLEDWLTREVKSFSVKGYWHTTDE